MDDGHGCGAWDEWIAFRDQVSENVVLQRERLHGVGAMSRILGRGRIRQRDRVVTRPGERRINSMLAVLGMIGCEPVVAQLLEGKVELEDVAPLKGAVVTKYVSRGGPCRHLAGDDSVNRSRRKCRA